MKIGIVSDSHNDRQALLKVATFLKSQKIFTVLHCGDVTDASMLECFSGFNVYLVAGNMDINPMSLQLKLQQLNQSNQFGKMLHLTFDGKRFFMIHGDNDFNLEEPIRSGQYDYVLHGHTHQREDYHFEDTRIICPGALGGRFREQRSFAVLDIGADDLSFVFLD